MAVLVLGGAGFVGSHLVDDLLVQGMEVMVIDDLSTGRLANLQRWRGHPRLDFVRADACDPVLLARACDHKSWVFCSLPAMPSTLFSACEKVQARRLVLLCPPVGAPERLSACELVLDGAVVYGPRGPREGSLFVSDVVRAAMLAAMNWDARGRLSLCSGGVPALGWRPLVDRTTGDMLIEAYERANPTTLIVSR